MHLKSMYLKSKTEPPRTERQILFSLLPMDLILVILLLLTSSLYLPLFASISLSFYLLLPHFSFFNFKNRKDQEFHVHSRQLLLSARKEFVL